MFACIFAITIFLQAQRLKLYLCRCRKLSTDYNGGLLRLIRTIMCTQTQQQLSGCEMPSIARNYHLASQKASAKMMPAWPVTGRHDVSPSETCFL